MKDNKEHVIDRSFYYRLYPGEATLCIYGLPKIHKDGAPLRPIVSSINSVTYNIANKTSPYHQMKPWSPLMSLHFSHVYPALKQ